MNTKHAALTLILGVGAFVAVRLALLPGAAPIDSGASLPFNPSDLSEGGVSQTTEFADPGSLVANDRQDAHTHEFVEEGPSPAPRDTGEFLTLAIEEEEEHFKWLRGTTDTPELTREFAELEDTLNEVCREEAFRRLSHGEYEVLPPNAAGGDIVLPGMERRFAVDYYSLDPNGKAVRITLPETEFPEAHKLKREMMWINDLIRDATSAQAPDDK